jgi:hypothetical protein
MERHEDAVFALSKLNLDNIEKTIQDAYHQKGPGRPTRSAKGRMCCRALCQLRKHISQGKKSIVGNHLCSCENCLKYIKVQIMRPLENRIKGKAHAIND